MLCLYQQLDLQILAGNNSFLQASSPAHLIAVEGREQAILSPALFTIVTLLILPLYCFLSLPFPLFFPHSCQAPWGLVLFLHPRHGERLALQMLLNYTSIIPLAMVAACCAFYILLYFGFHAFWIFSTSTIWWDSIINLVSQGRGCCQ